MSNVTNGRAMTVAEFNLETVRILEGLNVEMEAARMEYEEAKAIAGDNKKRWETLRDELSRTIDQRKARFEEMNAGQQFMSFNSADGPVETARRNQRQRRGRLALEESPSTKAEFGGSGQ